MKIWLITGSSRGLGAAITARALAEGDTVIGTARDAKDVTARHGKHERLRPASLDVTHEQQARDAVARAMMVYGRVDVLVNNAGYGLLPSKKQAPQKSRRSSAPMSLAS